MANYLRDNLASTNLYRLTGIKDKSITGYEKNKKMYNGLIEYIKGLEETELNLVFDRTFFTEEVYANLGYKDYKFHDVYLELVDKLNELNFNIYFVVLYLEDTSLYEKRLVRQHHNYQAFSLKNSIDQQNEYLNLQDNMDKENITNMKIATDDYDTAYKLLIDSIPVLKENIKEYKGL